LKNQIIKVDFGVIALKDIPVVSSRKVAEIFNKRHDNVLRDIEIIKNSLLKIEEPNWNKNFIESFYGDRGKKYPEYLLSRDGFTLLAMGFTGKKAVQFKVAYINCFNEMEQLIKSRYIARLESRELTDAVQLLHDPPKHYHFSNEYDMINKIVLGMRSREFKLKHGIPKDEQSIRPWLSLQEIQAIEKLQGFDKHLAKVIPDYRQRQKYLQDYFEKITERKLCLTGS
jgi:Rha family phage regulatory protein